MKTEKTYSGRWYYHPVINGWFVAWDLNGNKQTFSNKELAIKFAASGSPLQEYRGFQFCYPGRVFKNGVHIFTAHLFDSFDDAKKFIDKSIRQQELSSYEADRYGTGGNFPDEAAENDHAERFSQWMAEEAEQQLIEHEK